MYDKKQMKWMFVGLCAAVVGLMVYLVLTQFGGGSKAISDGNVVTSLPDGEAREMASSKSEAFRGSVSTDAYFEMLAGDVAPEEEISLVSDSLKASRPAVAAPAPAGGSAVERVFGAAPSDGDARSGPGITGSGRRSGGGGSAGASRPMTSEERLEYDRQRAEMVRDVLSGGSPVTEEAPVTEHAPESIDLSAVGSSDGIVSSLDDEFEDAAVQYEGAKRPFKCMFVRDEKLKSGQRVTLRLLEDYSDGGVRIPANTHLQAICKIGDRLELSVRSLDLGGRIVPLALDAYDTDGLQGIYCPETSSARASKQASQDAIQTAGTTFGGLVGDLASTVLRTGASIARSATGEVSVSVVSGYEFYLVKSEKR